MILVMVMVMVRLMVMVMVTVMVTLTLTPHRGRVGGDGEAIRPHIVDQRVDDLCQG